MPPEDVVEKLSEHDVKIERILFYQGSELHREELEDLISSYDNDGLSKILGESVIDLTDSEILEYIDQNYVGWFIAEVHTPTKSRSKRGILSWSWGLTTYTLLFSTSFEELVEKSCEWADKTEEARRSKDNDTKKSK